MRNYDKRMRELEKNGSAAVAGNMDCRIATGGARTENQNGD